ncbi:hypothetical protein AB0910_13590 [Streptomyces sp. NPDC047002]|uniref:hypothetical protein n=1 Tax=Streptomyces sp. NPDC047002 TaxID=3155475 RepID=UPI003456E385
MNDSIHTVDALIYDSLIAERGDVIADAARVAEQTRREADRALDFGMPDLPTD